MRTVVRSATDLVLLASLFWIAPLTGVAEAQGPSSPSRAAVMDGPPAPLPPEVVARDAAGRATVRAVRLPAPVVLDGRLDEEFYGSVPAITDFIQQEPHEGVPATEKTEAWIFFDDEKVYVALRCWMTDPDRIVANEMRRDNINIWYNDNVGIAFDTFHDRRGEVFFQTNALGGVRDGIVTDEVNVNYDFDVVWDVKSQRFDRGWTSELAIPFKSLRYRAGREQVWGLILQRVIRSKNEFSYVTRMAASYGAGALFRSSAAATLVGIVAPPPALNLDIKPYLISDAESRLVAPAGSALGARGGIDVKYGVTKSLTADFTYNTDFAQVEADDQQINLTRFNLFVPEKREFFLEGQGIFAFGGVSTSAVGSGPGDVPVLFFSRAIGLNNGQTVPIDLGARLTGRAGKFTIGLVDIKTAESQTAGAAATTFSVIRVKRDILRRSAIGVIATNRSRSAGGPGSNQVGGLDAAFQFFDNVRINTYYARTTAVGSGNDAESYSGQFIWAADRYGVEVNRLKVGAGFDPGIGFLRRRDFRRTYGLLRFSPRPRGMAGIRKFGYEASLDNFLNGAGQLETRQALGTFRIYLENGDEFDVNQFVHQEVLHQPFAVSKGVILPPGTYKFDETRANYQLGPQRRVTGTATISVGTFYDGAKTEVGYTGRVEVNRHFLLEPRTSINWVDLPEGRFTARVIGTRTTVTLTPRTFVAALVQYNSTDNSVGVNTRFRWEYQPGSDLFVVYNEGRDTLARGFPELLRRSFTVKFTRLFRF